MYKKNIALVVALMCCNASYAWDNFDQDHYDKEQKNHTQSSKHSSDTTEELDLKKDYEQLSRDMATLTTGYSKTNTSFYTAFTGIGLIAISYFVDKKNSSALFGAGVTLLGGGFGLGTVSMLSEHGKLTKCIQEKESIRSHMQQKRHHH